MSDADGDNAGENDESESISEDGTVKSARKNVRALADKMSEDNQDNQES